MIIPIRGAAVPESSQSLQEAIQAGFGGFGVVPRAVVIDAPSWPALGRLEVDLSGATVAEPEKLPRVAGPAEGSLSTAELRLVGKPLTVRGVPAALELHATDAVLQLNRLTNGEHALVLQRASDGSVDLSIRQGELEAAVQAILSQLAGKQGVNIVSTKLAFRQRGPRSLTVEAEVTAKVMLMKAPIALVGDLDLDDHLQVRVSNLQLSGGGMVAGLARGFLQPHFDKIQQNPIKLGALALGELRLRDVGVAVEGETLRVSAKFGS